MSGIRAVAILAPLNALDVLVRELEDVTAGPLTAVNEGRWDCAS